MPINLNQPLAWKQANGDEKTMLKDLQGNILKGHGRERTANVFLQFDPAQPQAARAWLRKIAKKLTSARQQLKDTEKFKQTRQSGGLFYTFYLTAAGYQALGIPTAQLPGAPNDAFQQGMKARQGELNDPPSQDWEPLFQQTIHAMLLIADETEAPVLAALQDVQASLPQAVKLLGFEPGRVYRNANGNNDGVEHFGYVDGRSQPLLLVEDILKEQQTRDGISVFDPSAPLKQALVPCPGGEAGKSFGSFFVFRKLEQNVKGFKDLEEKLAEKLGLQGPAEERAGALVVGRFEDGTPVTLQFEEGAHHPVPNNFSYADDQAGSKCPFQAHIRKTNPRGDTVKLGATLEQERSHRLVRRGIPYGDRPLDEKGEFLEDDKPTGGVGLLFMDYQSSIENQFEFVQAAWANNPSFTQNGTGIDPVIGQGPEPNPKWPKQWGGKEKESFGFAGFVTLKGGEYFFAPCLSFLKNL